MAGTGKTTIAYSLCLSLNESNELGASFFCSRQIPECRDVNRILPAIAYQLARFSHPFRCALSQVLEFDPDVHTRALKIQFMKLLAEPLSAVQDTLPSLVVVIDALDECEDRNSVAQILDMLLGTSELPIRFLLSSRPEPEIYCRMMGRVGGAASQRLVLHDLNKTRVEHDIQTFLMLELEGILSSAQIVSLVQRAGVLFIYAATAVRYIKDGVEFGEHEERLDMILKSTSISSSLTYRDIDELYSAILKAAFENPKLSEITQGRMKKLLDTIVCLQEPVTLDILATLLQLRDSQQVEGLLRPLCSVLNIAETTGLVTTLHASFPDFMLDNNRPMGILNCDSKLNHMRLTEACFRVITTNEPQFNICALESSYLCDDDAPNMAKRADEAVSPTLFYACWYWVSHLELSEGTMDMSKLLHDFLSRRLLLWMEVLNVKKCIRLGPAIIQRAENWSSVSHHIATWYTVLLTTWWQTHNYSNDTSELGHDAWRFMTTFASHAVSRSTPHIYVSMLPFWPESTPIAKHYNSRMQGGIEVQGTALRQRQLALLATWSFDNIPRSACFSPDGSLIAFGCSFAVLVIDGTSGRTVLGPLSHQSDALPVAFSPDGTLITSGSTDGSIEVWSAQSGQRAIGPLKGHTGTVWSVCFSPDSTRIVSGSSDKTIRIWDLQGGYIVLGPLDADYNIVHSVCFSPDGDRVVSGSDDETLGVWDAQSGQMLLGPLKGHTSHVLSVCFSPDGTRIASGSGDHTIRIWDAKSGAWLAGPLEGHSGLVCSAAFSPNGMQIISGSDDHTIRIWNLGAGVSSRVLEGHQAYLTSVAFSPDGTRIVSTAGDKTVRLWDAQSQATTGRSLGGHSAGITSVGFSPCGRHIASGSVDKTVRLWDSKSGQMLGAPFEGHIRKVSSVCFSPDGERIASGSEDGTVRIWELQSGQTVVGPLKAASLYVDSVCFSPDGTRVASGSFWDMIKLWDAQSGEMIAEPFQERNCATRPVCFSPDGTRIAFGSSRTIRVWDVQSEQAVVGPLEGHTYEITSVSWSPNGTRIVSGSRDKTLQVWEAQTGRLVLGPLEGHIATVKSVCFSPSNAFIASCSDDGTIRLWDAQSGQVIGRPLVGHAQAVNSIAFSPDGMHIASGSSDGTIRVWDVHDFAVAEGSEGMSCSVFKRVDILFSLLDLPSYNPAADPHARLHQFWEPREDGWVVDPQSRLLAWVPPDLQSALLSPRNPLIIPTQAATVQLGFDSAKLGESWDECFKVESLTH